MSRIITIISTTTNSETMSSASEKPACERHFSGTAVAAGTRADLGLRL